MSQLIHKKMLEVMKKIGPIAKGQRNDHQNYVFRGIDDVYNALNGPLSDIGVFYVPEVLESKGETFTNNKGTVNHRVQLKVKYTFFAEDGSSVTAVSEGEAIDQSDKATNKALQAALKYMLIQIFCIPTRDSEDADKHSPDLPQAATHAMPKNPAREMRPKTSSAGDYIIPFGRKYKGKKLSDIGTYELEEYCNWLAESSQKSGQPISPAVRALFDKVNEYLDNKPRNEAPDSIMDDIDPNWGRS